MATALRQIWALMSKNFRILLVRHLLGTIVIAFVSPIIITAVFSFAKNLFSSPAEYGVGSVRPIRSLPEALALAADDDRKTIAFVNNGLTGGDIDSVIGQISTIVASPNVRTVNLTDADDLAVLCRSSLRGVSRCYGAVEFHSSPSEGSGGTWNYTLRLDGALDATRIDIKKTDNDAETYVLPLKKAVDTAISSVDSDATTLPQAMDSLPYTDMTSKERDDEVTQNYQEAVINWMGVVLASGVLLITYHLTGFMTQEKETGMSRLIDSMMPVKKRWHSICMRMFAAHMSFSIINLPAWILGAIIMRQGVFTHTSPLIVILFQILAGLSMASFSVFASAFFKSAQISGNTTIIVAGGFAIMAQMLGDPNSATVAILSLIFPPCAYIFFVVLMSRFEYERIGASLIEKPPTGKGKFELVGIAFWVFLLIQTIVYPILGALLENRLYGPNSQARQIIVDPAEIEKRDMKDTALVIDRMSKVYTPSRFNTMLSCFQKPKGVVTAVNELSLNAGRGQIIVLLGANGSGKSTTLDAISGMHQPTSGSITIDGTGGLGIAPQKNVLWDDLTVEEHISIFNRLKSPNNQATKEEIRALIEAVDLGKKRTALSSTLSGGQKRKLQLGMMLTGGSAVCCVDEVSSGIDPLSRRKLWDILLAERGKRTIILTTHFLDEADLLADQIAVLSKGVLKAKGASAKLKDTLGGGYRVHVTTHGHINMTPEIRGVERVVAFDIVTYIAPSSALAAQVIRELENIGLNDYRFSGPTIEDVFLRMAEEIHQESVKGFHEGPPTHGNQSADGSNPDSRLRLTQGQPTGYFRQVAVLFRKRLTVLKTSWIPHFIAFVIPIIGALLTSLLIKDQNATGCAPSDSSDDEGNEADFKASDLGSLLLIGSSSAITDNVLRTYLDSGNTSFSRYGVVPSYTLVDTMAQFTSGIGQNYSSIAPGGLFIPSSSSDTATLAYKANDYITNALISQNTFNSLMSGLSINTQIESFATPWNPSMGDSLQLVLYMCIALVVSPAFFALYPNIERRALIRSFEYSNGVRPGALWLAYTAVDFLIFIASSVVVIVIWVAMSDAWFHVGYLFLIILLFGLASILLGYVASLFVKTQLGTYAYVAGFQFLVFAVYFIAYMSTLSFASVTKVDDQLLLVHYVASAFAPIGSIIRALFVALNVFSTTCDNQQLASNPVAIKYYGGPILYLVLQTILYTIILLSVDGGGTASWFRKVFSRGKTPGPGNDTEDGQYFELKEPGSSVGLQVQNLTKTFGKNTAVDNVSFDIRKGEVYALLGPNGAGKSTTISMIRGDLRPSGKYGGDVLVENFSVTRDLVSARANLGVCPQFDAIDRMTVKEHLEFYARVRGVPDMENSVSAIISAVGLGAFAARPAHALSGGNKRKLSLGIALMGNPGVVVLDEPSSGLDAAAKRIMWKTLQNTVPGRSILLTTHSMEEADALAGRIGIMAKRMLASGTIDELRARFGDALHIHLVSKTAPHTSDREMAQLQRWIQANLPDVVMQDKTYHGQTRFSVPARSVLAATGGPTNGQASISAAGSAPSAIGRLLVLLEDNKDMLGIQHYSVSTTTLDQVFLAIVGEHDVQEENSGEHEKRAWWKRLLMK
ncbi:ABC transporter [Ceratocystis lukuohia]|uniref:ABC transporter n=1 Tax=Ceratocystis lukuohia TaxID=2019550 RepID=A0ABR4MI90_9PEZI